MDIQLIHEYPWFGSCAVHAGFMRGARIASHVSAFLDIAGHQWIFMDIHGGCP
jgi:hypothetical protein